MKLENRNGLRVLTPESDDFILYNVRTNSYCDKVFLGVNDSIDNYREMEKDLLEKDETSKIEELQAIIDKQNESISKLAEQLACLAELINKEDK